jgi:hypothetical protein
MSGLMRLSAVGPRLEKSARIHHDPATHGQIGRDGDHGRVPVEVFRRVPVEVAEGARDHVRAQVVRPLRGGHPVVLLHRGLAGHVLGLGQEEGGPIGGSYQLALEEAPEGGPGVGAVVVAVLVITGLVLSLPVVVDEVPLGQEPRPAHDVGEGGVGALEAGIQHGHDDSGPGVAGVVRLHHPDLLQLVERLPVVEELPALSPARLR